MLIAQAAISGGGADFAGGMFSLFDPVVILIVLGFTLLCKVFADHMGVK